MQPRSQQHAAHDPRAHVRRHRLLPAYGICRGATAAIAGSCVHSNGKSRFAAAPMSDATPRIAVLFSARNALWRIDKNITAAFILVICHAATSAGGRAHAIARAKCPHEHQEQGGSHNETITGCEPIICCETIM